MKLLKARWLVVLVLFVVGAVALHIRPAQASGTPYFPIIGSAHFSNDYYGARSQGYHRATDIFASKMSPIIAAVEGRVQYVNVPQASWGYSVGIKDTSGMIYRYIHMNNDTPGTDDGAGTEMYAYASYVKVGNWVEKGQLLGYVGDSGNAETTPPHLHFEIEAPSGEMINPYDHLLRWTTVSEKSLFPPLPGETLPYWVAHRTGLNVAMGDLDNDGDSETAVVPSGGAAPLVRIYSGTNNNYQREFKAYGTKNSGADVAIADVSGDSKAEIITVAGAGVSAFVRIFSDQGQLLGQFTAYPDAFMGGATISAGDVDGDGKAEIITGAGPSGGPWVEVFEANGTKIGEFLALSENFRGGIDVAAADTVDSTAKEIIVGPGAGADPKVKIFRLNGSLIKDFLVYDQRYQGGIRVSGGNVKSSSAKDELMTIPANKGESRVRLMKNTGENIEDYPYLETWWRGYYDVAAGIGESRVVTGVNRRSSMRNGPDN